MATPKSKAKAPREVKQVKLIGTAKFVFGKIEDDIERVLVLNEMIDFSKKENAERFVEAFAKVCDPAKAKEVSEYIQSITAPVAGGEQTVLPSAEHAE